MALNLFNTMSRRLEPFVPVKAGEAGFYGCGPTVYNYAHIGNLRAYVTHDVLSKTLRRLGYKVTHVMNITDVGHLSGDDDAGDDKMVKSAEERGKTVLEVADFYTKAFFEDTSRLNIARPDVVCKATEHIDAMIALIRRIEARGWTYQAGGNLYYDISRFANYGDLARLKLESLKTGARTEIDVHKRNGADFVLWFTKSKFENQALVWDSPWGRGYPGWHIECSAMSIQYLGEQFDIHAGGIDHIQIHHSNEIAQSEAATGKHPWVKYWVHNEFLVLDKEKMSKSSGSFITLQTLIDEGYHPLDYRYFLLGGHYRSQLQFSWESISGARNARKSLVKEISALALRAERLPPPDAGAAAAAAPVGKAAEYLAAFDAALEDDLNTPRALSALRMLLKDSAVPPEDALAACFQMDTVLALDLARACEEALATARNAASACGGDFTRWVEEQIALRAAAKKAKNFAEADRLRAALKERGVALEDGPGGTSWKRCAV
ncbi:MAG: cysteine--tRNA ligase [Spirochaetaceae bacterium]|jgi:cysteinyl-tRNA synthetase|nr:cysteine--tRNA ligase [Spirochaetaceae bacterium]